MVKYHGMKNLDIPVKRESGRSKQKKVNDRPLIGSFSLWLKRYHELDQDWNTLLYNGGFEA
jgi:hypothetical protein